MKRHASSLPILGLAALALVSSSILAAELPKRKPGLWEISMQMEGVPNMGAIQQCIDQNTDNLLQQQAQKNKPDCSVLEVKPSGNRIVIHTVCKVEGSTATTDGMFEGSFEANYQGTLKTRFNPPLHGMNESNMTQQARWLGPCKAGQKPGDVVLPNMGGFNINEMMKGQPPR